VKYLQVREEEYTTIVAALALAAQMYSDPEPCYAAIEAVAPGTSQALRSAVEGKTAQAWATGKRL
jgi:hypothetical protein